MKVRFANPAVRTPLRRRPAESSRKGLGRSTSSQRGFILRTTRSPTVKYLLAAVLAGSALAGLAAGLVTWPAQGQAIDARWSALAGIGVMGLAWVAARVHRSVQHGAPAREHRQRVARAKLRRLHTVGATGALPSGRPAATPQEPPPWAPTSPVHFVHDRADVAA